MKGSLRKIKQNSAPLYSNHGALAGNLHYSVEFVPGGKASNASSFSAWSFGGTGGKTRALLIGINYTSKSQGKLRGCINDVEHMQELLKTTYDCKTFRVLTDHAGASSSKLPTADNIREGIRWLLNGVKKGDKLWIHYSGHGTQVPDDSGDEADGLDESLVPLDFTGNDQSTWITDDELRGILFNQVPDGVSLTAVFDCCHSGTLSDLKPVLRTSSSGGSGSRNSGQEDRDLPTRDFSAGVALGTRGDLCVEVLSAENLYNSDVIGKSDPYCVVTVVSEGKVHGKPSKSGVKENTLNPTWNETFEFKNVENGSRAVVEIRDKDTFGSDDVLGTTILRLDGMFEKAKSVPESQVTEERTLDVLRKGGTVASGTLKVRVSVSNVFTNEEKIQTKTDDQQQGEENLNPTLSRFLEPSQKMKDKIAAIGASKSHRARSLGGGGGMVSGFLNSIGLTKRDQEVQIAKKKAIVVISACRDDQTAADAYVQSKYQGALTYSILESVKNLGPNPKFNQLMPGLRDNMVKKNWSQVPQCAIGGVESSEDPKSLRFMHGWNVNSGQDFGANDGQSGGDELLPLEVNGFENELVSGGDEALPPTLTNESFEQSRNNNNKKNNNTDSVPEIHTVSMRGGR